MSQPPSSPRLIHIHEDDWGLRNLYPIEALAGARSDMDEARTHSEEARDPSGCGWTSMHLIGEPSVSYADLGVTPQAFATAFTALEARAPRFYATASAGFDLAHKDPWGSYDEDALCFGDSGCFIKIDVREGLARAVWYACEPGAANAARLRRLLMAANSVHPSVIADYASEAMGAIADAAFFDAYIASLAMDGGS
jgi:hypothetical protein